MPDRDLDVVVFGATGVTGRGVAAYLAQRAPSAGATWAAAARDPAKLARLGVQAPETLAADVGDPASLLAMAQRARVVLNLVGPYTTFGRPVIEACVAGGAHYADLSGEIPFVRRINDAFDARAAEAGVKVVQVCGFEALPPDLSVLLAAEAAGEPLADVDLTVSTRFPPGLPRPSDGLSGGTMQSLAAAAGAEGADELADPAGLVDDPALAAAIRERSPIAIAPRRGAGGAVIAPMTPAAFINPQVIHRSAALRGAQPFRYREGVALGGGPATLPLRFAAAGMAAGLQAGIGALARARPATQQRVARLLSRALPSSGFGPTGPRLEQWSWTVRTEATTASGRRVTVTVDADGHPGYLSTARMLGEVGLLLAEDGATPQRAGCVTPAIALGAASAPRFEHARVRFSVES